MTDDICQENVMKISNEGTNEGTGQDFLNKVNIKKYRKIPWKMVHKIYKQRIWYSNDWSSVTSSMVI